MAVWNEWKPRRGYSKKICRIVYWVEKPYYVRGVRQFATIIVPTWEDALAKAAELNIGAQR